MSEIPRSIRDNNDPEKERDRQRALEDMDIPGSELSKGQEEENKAEENKEAEYEEMSIEELRQNIELLDERIEKLGELWNKIQREFSENHRVVPEELREEVNRKFRKLMDEKQPLTGIFKIKCEREDRGKIDDLKKEIEDL